MDVNQLDVGEQIEFIELLIRTVLTSEVYKKNAKQVVASLRLLDGAGEMPQHEPTYFELSDVTAYLPYQYDALRAHCAALQRDARRYRWLRDHCRVTAEAKYGYPEHAALVYYYGLKTPNDMHTYTPEGLNDAIDAALASSDALAGEKK